MKLEIQIVFIDQSFTFFSTVSARIIQACDSVFKLQTMSLLIQCTILADI
jgi:hypothetical protein